MLGGTKTRVVADRVEHRESSSLEVTARDLARNGGGDEDTLRAVSPVQQLVYVRVDLISPAPDGQTRKAFADERLQSLAESIKRSGVREPIIVTPHGAEPGRFEIVAGERRWRAAQLAGLAEIPCLVDGQLADRRDKLLAQAEENLHRENLNPVEEASVLVQLMEARGIGLQEAGELIGKSARQARRLQQLHLTAAPIKRAVARGELDARAALEMVRVFNRFAREDESASGAEALRRIDKLVGRVVREQWSIRKLEQYAAKLVGTADEGPPSDAGSDGAPSAETKPPTRARPASSGSNEAPPARLFTRDARHLVVDLDRLTAGALDPDEREQLIAVLEETLAQVRRA